MPDKPELDPIVERELKFQEENAHDKMKRVALRAIRNFAEMATRAGIEPEKVYATVKTGLIPTSANLQFMPKEDFEEWQDAVQEYTQLLEESLD